MTYLGSTLGCKLGLLALAAWSDDVHLADKYLDLGANPADHIGHASAVACGGAVEWARRATCVRTVVPAAVKASPILENTSDGLVHEVGAVVQESHPHVSLQLRGYLLVCQFGLEPGRIPKIVDAFRKCVHNGEPPVRINLALALQILGRDAALQFQLPPLFKSVVVNRNLTVLSQPLLKLLDVLLCP